LTLADFCCLKKTAHCERTRLQITPEEIGETLVGHFVFSHSPHQERLCAIALNRRRKGKLVAKRQGGSSRTKNRLQTK